LIIPCEISSKSIIPAIKALMAEELVERHGLNQSQVAELLGISQSAVSKYTRKVRGHTIRIDHIEEIRPHIDSMITILVNGSPKRTELLKYFCQTCLTIRRKGPMCQFCQKADPKIKIEECDFCFSYHPC
jgi:predicted transcriptional regulator